MDIRTHFHLLIVYYNPGAVPETEATEVYFPGFGRFVLFIIQHTRAYTKLLMKE